MKTGIATCVKPSFWTMPIDGAFPSIRPESVSVATPTSKLSGVATPTSKLGEGERLDD